LNGVSAKDNRDGDLSDKIVVEHMQLVDDSGRILVSYAVADSSGNVAKLQQEVRYSDYESPKFTLSEALIYEDADSFDIMNVVGAQDVIDGDIQHRIRVTALTEGSITDVGKHEVYFQVTNSLGDTAELAMSVEVFETGIFDGKLKLTDYLIYLPKGSTFKPTEYLDSFEYKAESTTLAGALPRNYELELIGAVTTEEPGVYPLGYKVTYTIRHATNPDYDQKITAYSKLIVIVEG
jgi:hypothetical protein